MSIRRRLENLEKAKTGTTPPIEIVIQVEIGKQQIAKEGEEIEKREFGVNEYSVPNGPLGSGGKLTRADEEPMPVFRGRIRDAYESAWGVRANWLELPHYTDRL